MTGENKCSRCGKPSGEDESQHYKVSEATITMKSGQTLELRMDPALATMQLRKTASVKIETAHGNRYPEGSWSTAVVVDCCTSCFQKYALPALIKAGFKSREEERDW